MNAELTDLDAVLRLAVAALVGLTVGVEREWSGKASGPRARFAGVRTFLLLGLLGGVAGLLCAWDLVPVGAALAGGTAAFVAAAYVMAVRRQHEELDGTTEGAALVVLALALLAGLGHIVLAAGTVALVALALGEKERLHWLVGLIDEKEMRAALQFAVLSLVVLPLLPDGPYGPLGGVRPRTLWGLALLLAGLDFAGYVARRAVGPGKGYGVTGLLGGLISSTAVTINFARVSRDEPQIGRPLAIGVIAACTVLFARVTVVAAILNPDVAKALVPLLVPGAVAGSVLLVPVWRRTVRDHVPRKEMEPRNPLRFWWAMKFAIGFQLGMMAITLAQNLWGERGLLTSAALLGLADVDALTVSMARLARATTTPELAALGITIGILTDTVLKLGLAVIIGTATFRRFAGFGLAVLSVGLAVGVLLFA
jgi:uncharacterized membrane protein (DUF4010 family)